nr:MAG TPA: hypothetical protein [Caudoviricetes sp.]
MQLNSINLITISFTRHKSIYTMYRLVLDIRQELS